MDNIVRFIQKFSNEEECIKLLIESVYPDGIECPFCGSKHIIKFKDNKRFKCSICRKQFSYRKGTFMENSNVEITKWFVALYLCLSNKKGISSYQLSEYIEVTQSTAWFMLQRIRNVLMENQKNMENLANIVEMDEVYIGGINKWRHAKKKKKSSDRGYSTNSKTAIIGMVEREGNLKMFKVKRVNARTVRELVDNHINPESVLMTDEHKVYLQFDMDMIHYIVEHGAGQYVIGDSIYTNTVEGSFAHLKGTLRGTFHNRMTRKYLELYGSTYAFRYNTRLLGKIPRLQEFLKVCKHRLRKIDMIMIQ